MTEITRRQFLAGAGAAAVTLPLLKGLPALADSSAPRPNFVFILTDDQRWDAMSCMGHPFAKTPNIDSIARDGARFANAFVTTSLCSPSRASFMTGMYAHQHGVIDNARKIDRNVVTFPRLLQKAGYQTAFLGKWHMHTDGDPEPGFDHWVSFFDQGMYWNPTFNVDGKQVKSEGYVTDLLTNYAVDWLKQPRTQPFCLFLWHKAVHAEFSPAARHKDLYSDIQVKKPPSMDEPLEGKPEWSRKLHGSWDKPEDYEKNLDKIKNYYRTLAAVDESVGTVLGTLKSLGVLDNTLVAFGSDNGYFLGEHGLGDKRAMYEESIRIPFLVRYPKLIKPGSVINEMVLNVDVAPAFLELAGVTPPDNMEGKSFLPLLEGRTDGWRKDFLYEYFWEEEAKKRPEIRGVRTERWKYITYPGSDNIPELYDIKTDPLEMHNVIDNPANAGVLADMKALLDKRLAEAKAHTKK